jgi:hypothetical protein
MNAFCYFLNYQVDTRKRTRLGHISFLCLEIDIERCVRASIDIFTLTPRSCMYREHASDQSIYQINNDLVSVERVADVLRSFT